MNSINRFLVSLVATVLILAGVYVLLLASGTVDPGTLDGELLIPLTEGIVADTGADLWVDLETAISLVAVGIAADMGADLWVDVGIAISLIAVGMVLLIVQLGFAGDRRSAATVLLRDDEEGRVRISVESIRQLTERTSYGVRSVRGAKGSVRVTPGGLRLGCDLTLHMAADLPAATAEVQRAVREVVERLTGLKVIDVSVRARYGRERDEPVLAK